jgi:hypothetical protein
MKPSELRFLLDKASAGAEVYKSIFITTEEDALRTRTRGLLPLLLQLWEAADTADVDPVGIADFHIALKALNQYGEGER